MQSARATCENLGRICARLLSGVYDEERSNKVFLENKFLHEAIGNQNSVSKIFHELVHFLSKILRETKKSEDGVDFS